MKKPLIISEVEGFYFLDKWKRNVFLPKGMIEQAFIVSLG